MQQVIINVGVSGSGKSTWSTEFIRQYSKVVRINRDSLRLMYVGDLDGYYQRKDLQLIESLVSQAEDTLLVQALARGFSVIIDNTNLSPKYIHKWMDIINDWNTDEEEKVQVKFRIFPEANVTILKKRVNVRDAPLGWDKLDYIDKQVVSLKNAVSFVEQHYKDKIIL